MNAKEAKAQAEKHVKTQAETRKLQIETQKNENVTLLYTHMCNKIDEAVALGKLSTDAAGIDIKFPDDRFTDDVISDVVNMLRQNGFNVNKIHHNAFKTIKFDINWI
jgi:hypothetical protein